MTKERAFYKLAPAAQTALRRKAVALVAGGMTRIQAAQIVGVNRRFVGLWVAAVARSGEAALTGKRRGRRPGEQKALSERQERRLCRMIREHCPDDLRLSAPLWTRELAGALIARETGIHLSASGVGRYLRAWGLTMARPDRRQSARRGAEARAWRATYPAIARRAQDEGGEVHWITTRQLVAADGDGAASVAAAGQSRDVWMVASLTNQGKLRFMLHDGPPGVEAFLHFLHRLARAVARKIFVILADAPPHRAAAVTRWARQHPEQVELFYR